MAAKSCAAALASTSSAAACARRQREPLQRQQPLAVRAKPRARRRADAQARRARDQPLDQARQLGQMLGVVEHQQHLARREVVADQRQRLLLRPGRELQFGGQARDDLRDVLQIVERDPVRAVGKARLQPAQRTLGEAALADAARPGDGEQAAVVAREQRQQGLEIVLAAEQPVLRGLRRQRPARPARRAAAAAPRRPAAGARAATARRPARLRAAARSCDRRRAAHHHVRVHPAPSAARPPRPRRAGRRRAAGRRAAPPRRAFRPARPGARVSASARGAGAAHVRRRAIRSRRRWWRRPCRRAVRRPRPDRERRQCAPRASPTRSRAHRWRRSSAPQRPALRAHRPTAARAPGAAPCARWRPARSPAVPGQNSAASSARPTQPRRSASSASRR